MSRPHLESRGTGSGVSASLGLLSLANLFSLARCFLYQQGGAGAGVAIADGFSWWEIGQGLYTVMRLEHYLDPAASSQAVLV
jgi:hypothetical protein